MKTFNKNFVTLVFLFVTIAALAQLPSIQLLDPSSGKQKEISIGALLEVYQMPKENLQRPPFMYYGSLLNITSDSLQIALLEVPRVKKNIYASAYTKSRLTDFPKYHTIYLPDIEQINRTSNYKRSFGATVVRTLTVGVMGASGLLLAGSFVSRNYDSGIAKALLITSVIGFGIGISLHTVSKPKKYKINSEIGKRWKIISN